MRKPTHLQELRAWAHERARLIGHSITIPNRYSFEPGRHLGYLSSCAHCPQKFVLCLERRQLQKDISYSGKFSLETGHLLYLTDQYTEVRNVTGYLRSIFGQELNKKRFSDLPSYFHIIGVHCYHLDRTISMDEPMKKPRTKKFLCPRLKTFL
jgi:hypothetical protein